MKRKTSISHDEAIVRRIRKDSGFAAEYLKAALEDAHEPRVLLIALRHLAQVQKPKAPCARKSHVGF
jgi:DNA-binding phage protein